MKGKFNVWHKCYKRFIFNWKIWIYSNIIITVKFIGYFKMNDKEIEIKQL